VRPNHLIQSQDQGRTLDVDALSEILRASRLTSGVLRGEFSEPLVRNVAAKGIRLQRVFGTFGPPHSISIRAMRESW
jgi:hypothetical protein